MIIEKKLICLDIVGDNKQNIINNLSEVAFQNGKINDLEAYRNAVYKREEEFSTALGYLVAMPHGQSNGVNEPFVVFGRCKDEIVWDVIGSGSCRYARKTDDPNKWLCTSPYSVNGICDRISCPLANSEYNTIIEDNGRIMLA